MTLGDTQLLVRRCREQASHTPRQSARFGVVQKVDQRFSKLTSQCIHQCTPQERTPALFGTTVADLSISWIFDLERCPTVTSQLVQTSSVISTSNDQMAHVGV